MQNYTVVIPILWKFNTLIEVCELNSNLKAAVIL